MLVLRFVGDGKDLESFVGGSHRRLMVVGLLSFGNCELDGGRRSN